MVYQERENLVINAVIPSVSVVHLFACFKLIRTTCVMHESSGAISLDLGSQAEKSLTCQLGFPLGYKLT